MEKDKAPTTPRELLEQLPDTPPEVDIDEFEPLDQSIANDLEILRSEARSQLVERWKGGAYPVPESLAGEFRQWAAALDVERVAAYCGSTSALMLSALLNSDLENASGQIDNIKSDPWFRVVPAGGSVLAKEAGTAAGEAVVFSSRDIGHFVAVHCGEPPSWGELAWRSIAWCLAECEEPSLLPQLFLRKNDGGFDVCLDAESA